MKQNLTHIKDVANLLGVTRAMVYKRLAALNKKPTKVGGKSYIDGETLQEIQEGKRVSPKVSPEVSDGDNTATKQVDNELVNLLKNQINDLSQDKVALQRQVDIKDRQIEDLSNSGREMRLLLGAAQKQITGLLPPPAPIDEPLKPDYEPSTPVPNQPEMKPSKKKKKKKKKR